ncbi:MAG: hypothetical protein ACR2KG_12380 [Nocardioidaceae bacterium]
MAMKRPMAEGVVANDVVARAAVAIREEPQPGWVDITSTVLTKVRAATRHSWPVRAAFGDAARGDSAVGCGSGGRDSLHIADQVVVNAIRIALDPVPYCTPIAISLALDADICHGASVEVVSAYARDLIAVGDDVRAATGAALLRVLGPYDAGRRAIDVHVSDITANEIGQQGC